MKVSCSTQTLRAASVVYGLLPQIAGMVVGLSALGYFAGWKAASAYYAELGAPWALSLLSSAKIMPKSIVLASIVGITGFVSLIQLLNESSSPGQFRRWSIYMMLGATLLSGAGLAVYPSCVLRKLVIRWLVVSGIGWVNGWGAHRSPR